MKNMLVFLLLVPVWTGAQEVTVAVASNFVPAMEAVAREFEKQSGHRVVLVPGSTGKHYAQIVNAAPFDVFFAADRSRPQRLEKLNIAVPGSRFTYAVGRLVLWSRKPGYVDSRGTVLVTGKFQHLAIANPGLAPYGVAAKQVLQSMGLWQGYRGRLVQGENIAQAYQFIQSGNAALGLVALSQLKRPGGDHGSFWQVPSSLHDPIEQQAVILKNTEAARALVSFVRSDTALKIIRGYGYHTP